MPFRNPVFLNLDTLRSMADYYGIPIPEEAQITVQSRGAKEGRAGVKKVVELEKGKTSEEETSESYTRPVRPVRAFNDTLDSLLQDEQIVDLTSTPDAELILNTPIQANVDLSVSPATELGQMLGRFMPIIFGALAKGEEDPEITNEHVKDIMEGGSSSDHSQILDVEFESRHIRAIAIVDPKYIREGADIEDLVGEVTLFGVVSRVVGEGRTFSLEKHLLPGVNRTMRRMIAREGVDKFVGELKELVDGDIDAGAINISGPAVVIDPVAIF